MGEGRRDGDEEVDSERDRSFSPSGSTLPLHIEILTENKVNVEEEIIAKRYREKWDPYDII